MVTISKARNSVRLQTYHEKELSNGQENYYTDRARIDGEWRGHLAAKWGLTGSITSEQFARLAEGQHPVTGEQLIRHRLASEDAVAHRAGWDATFSAPKSISLTALVGGASASSEAERRLAAHVTEAHLEAARAGAGFLERYAQAHLGGNNGTETTGRLVYALFDHDSSRPVNGYAAPQLHTHVVIFNMTEDKDGKVRALNEKSLFEAQKAATAVYQAELRARLERLGFQIESGKNNAPEIVGFTEEYRRASSTRSEVIEQRAEELRRQLGISRVQARQMAALETREKKLDDTAEQMKAKHLARASEYGHQEAAVLAAALQRQASLRAELEHSDPMTESRKALTFARDHLFEHEAVNTESDLIRVALQRAEGRATLEHIDAVLNERRAEGEFIPMQNAAGRRAYTTAQVLATERANIRIMADGQDRHTPLVNPARIRDENLSRLDATGTGNQRDAAYQILTSRDRIQGLQGAAGTGKTFTLRTVREELENNGWSVRGFAPTAKASKELADSGIQTTTLQKYLVDSGIHPKAPGRTVYVLDESSLADSIQVNRLLKSLGPSDRLVLVGDVRQHEAVGQGRVFAQLQEQGMSTAHLTKIIRQNDAPDLKHVVELFYEGRIHEGIDILERLGCIKEIRNEQDRYEAIAREFMSEHDHTLVISPDNRSRAGINAVIHQHLQAAGQLDLAETRIDVLVNRQDISGAERGWAKRYEVGNVIRFERASKVFGFEQGEYATVTAVDPKQNTITVARADGESIAYNPERFCGPSSVTLYRPDQKSFSVGELIQFTSNSKDLGISNRDRAIITGFTEDGKVTAAIYHGADKPAGRSVIVDPKQFAHMDHAYAVTSYSSQGLTERADILNIDTNNMNPQLINDRLAYVAGSRMKSKLTIYCNDASQLAEALSRDVSKTSAIRPPESAAAERTRPPDLSAAVRLLAEGKASDALERLKSLGCVHEIADDAERYQTIAREYVAKEDRPAIVCASNSARAAINDVVHMELRAATRIERAEASVPVLIRRQDIADEQRNQANAYRIGNVLRYEDRRASKLAASQKEYATVTAVNAEQNTITVQHSDGRSVSYNPQKRSRVSVFTQARKTFAAGENLRFTSDYPPLKIKRDDRAKIIGIVGDGKLSVRLIPPDGKKHKARTVEIDPARCPHLDHAYATPSTFEARQRQTTTIIHHEAGSRDADGWARRLARAAETGRDPNLTFYCRDGQALADSLARSLAKVSRQTKQGRDQSPVEQRGQSRTVSPAISPSSNQQARPISPAEHEKRPRADAQHQPGEQTPAQPERRQTPAPAHEPPAPAHGQQPQQTQMPTRPAKPLARELERVLEQGPELGL